MTLKKFMDKDRLSFPVSLLDGVPPKISGYSTFRQVLQPRKLKNNAPPEYKQQIESPLGFIIGEYTEQGDSGCISYVPCLAFHLDGIGEGLATILLSDLKKIPYVFSAFFSPGTGLRVLIWCATDQNGHKRYYQALCRYLDSQLGENIKTDAEWKRQWKETGMNEKEIESRLQLTPHIKTSASDISHPLYYTPLPAAEIYLNTESRVFELPEKGKRVRTPRLKKKSVKIYHNKVWGAYREWKNREGEKARQKG